MGIKKVVNNTKNKEIPSIPIGKFKFKIGIQKNFSTYWKVAVDLLKKIHKTKDKTKVKHEKFKATDLNKNLFDDGIKSKIVVPIKGNINIKDNIFSKYNMIIKNKN